MEEKEREPSAIYGAILSFFVFLYLVIVITISVIMVKDIISMRKERHALEQRIEYLTK